MQTNILPLWGKSLLSLNGNWMFDNGLPSYHVTSADCHELGVIWHHKVGYGAQKHSIIKWKWYMCDQAQEGPEGISRSHEGLPKCLWFLLPLLSAAMYALIAHVTESLRKRINVGYWWFCSHNPEVDSFSITAPFWNNPKRYIWKKIFTMGRTSGSTLGHIFYLEGEIDM